MPTTDSSRTARKEIKPKRPPRTVKEKKFVKELIMNGGNKTQAAMIAYDVKDTNSASTIAAENVRKLTFDDYFEKAGLTDEAIANTIKEIVSDEKDPNPRLKGIDLAIKIMGKFAPVKTDITSGGEKIVPIFGATSVSTDQRHPQDLRPPSAP